jgi:hypothetical protein
LFKQFQTVYDVRSSIVHGSAVPVAELAGAGAAARRVAAATIIKGLRNGWPTPETLKAAALG